MISIEFWEHSMNSTSGCRLIDNLTNTGVGSLTICKFKYTDCLRKV